MRQLPDTYVVTEIARMDYRDNRIFVDKSEYDRLAAKIDRLTKERDEARRTVKMAHEEGTRQIATLQARIDELEAERTWRPIETAPKTGKTILLGYRNSLGNWRTMRGQWMSDEYIADCWEDPDDVEEGWFETSVEADDIPNCWRVEPTHWMPLPQSPEAKP